MKHPGTTLEHQILQALADAVKPLDDDQLAARLGVRRQAINQTARLLETKGLLLRQVSAGSKIMNVLPNKPGPPFPPPPPSPLPGVLLAEDEVKAAVRDHLRAQSYQVRVAWDHARGVDIEAWKPGEHILIEAKGEVASDQQQGNYFIGAIGELVQRFVDPDARYGIALPDNRRYRGLVRRLPALARQRLSLVVYMVSKRGAGYLVEEV